MAAPNQNALPGALDGSLLRRLLSLDHKRIGILYMLGAVLFLFVAGIPRLLVFVGLAAPDAGVSLDQVTALQATVLMFGFGLPLALGLATFLVPLQIGARGTSAPRLSATAAWVYIAGVTTLLAAFGVGDPEKSPGGEPLSADGQQLWVTGLLLVCMASVVAAAILVHTIWTRRTEGMTIGRLPIFTASAGLFAGALAIGMTLEGIAAFVWLIDAGSAASFFTYDVAEGASFYQSPGWAFTHPATLAQLIPVIGMASEAVMAVGPRAVATRRLALVALVAMSALVALVGLYHLFADPLGATFANGFTLVGFVLLGGLAPAVLAWLSELRGLRPPGHPIQVLVVGMVATLVLGTVLGFALGFPGDYKASTATANLAGFYDGMIAGTGLLGLAAGILYFFPKLSGRALDVRFTQPGSALLVLGTLCVLVGLHVSDDTGAGGWLALTGYLLTFLGAANLLGGAALALRMGTRVGNDPWKADTLEWYTTSPPPAENFDRVPLVESERPLHDLRLRLAGRT